MNPFLRTFAASSCLLLIGSIALAQEAESKVQPPQTSSTGVATLNVDRLIKEFPGIQDRLEPLRAEAKKLEETIQIRQIELESVQSQLRKTQPGSGEFVKLQQQFLKLNGELQQMVARERGNLQMQEAKVLLGVFREVDDVVKKLAKERGYKLVIRQQSTSFDDEQPLPEIMKTLNRIVFFEEGIDITDDVLAACAKKPVQP